MTGTICPVCRKLRPSADHTYAGKQGFSYFQGIARETTGALSICMHLLTIPPGGRAHKHTTDETAIFMRDGITTMFWGDALKHRMEVTAGDLVYIAAQTPHLPVNPSPTPARAVIAHTDPHEQESVVLLPELAHLAP